MVLLAAMKQIASYALLPKSSERWWLYSAIYGLIACGLFEGTDAPFHQLGEYHLPIIYLLIALGILLAFAAMLGLLTLLTLLYRMQIRGRCSSCSDPRSGKRCRFPWRWLAHKAVGKSVFLSRSYDLMKKQSIHPLIRMEPTEESEAALQDKLRELDQRRQWPFGDVEVSKIPFRLCYGPYELVRFNWMDLPGAAFTNITGDPGGQTEPAGRR